MVNRLLVGDYGDGTFGIKLSLPGSDVTSADAQHLVFDSKWAGAASVHVTGVSTIGSTVTFPTMGYIPCAIVSAYSSSTTLCPFWTQNVPETTRWTTAYTTKVSDGVPYSINTSSITFLPTPSGFTATYSTVRYVILRVAGN